VYPEFETRTSYKYLQKVISALEEPICIIGGWAVFFHVNKSFQKAQGRPYLGSRDIDLGFHLDKNATIEQMKNSSLAKSIEILEKELRFKSKKMPQIRLPNHSKLWGIRRICHFVTGIFKITNWARYRSKLRGIRPSL